MISRRDFIRWTSLTPLVLTPLSCSLAASATGWRDYEIRYHVDLPDSAGRARLWLPLPGTVAGDFQRPVDTHWNGTTPSVAGLYREPVYGARIFYAEWDPGGPRRLDVITHVAARDRSVLIDEDPASQDPPQDPEVALFLKPSTSMPTDGIVLDKAREITRCTHTPLQRARAIYEWIVENTFRDPKVKACGTGDIKVMLETGYLGGKCADINSLFVGLARASGLPAREVYGIRVAESAQFKSLGKKEDITRAQHCRAEFYLYPFGWVPVDPADVRKVVLEENLTLSDDRVAALRERLFGFWEMNWIAYNHARDFALTPPAHKIMTFFMYPHVELITDPGEVSEPSGPFYTISAREVPAEELGRPFPRV